MTTVLWTVALLAGTPVLAVCFRGWITPNAIMSAGLTVWTVVADDKLHPPVSLLCIAAAFVFAQRTAVETGARIALRAKRKAAGRWN